ncbi:unnamed protein product, partial [Phaeothamnion confervicola]
ENTGRWTYEEHRLFLKGLELHGKGWKKIAGLIKTRTVVQIRTHAQKYFQKLAKAKQNGEHGEIMMDSKGHGGKKKGKGGKRRFSLGDLLSGPTVVAPSLAPFVNGAGAIEPGLYRFLSPVGIAGADSQLLAAAAAAGSSSSGGDGSGSTGSGVTPTPAAAAAEAAVGAVAARAAAAAAAAAAAREAQPPRYR